MDAALRAQGLRLERTRASKQYRDGAFHNTDGAKGPGIKTNPLPLLGEYAFGDATRAPPKPLPLVSPLEAWAKAPDTGLRLTWLGHSTVLLEVGGARLLTDPVFGQRASPFTFMGPKRFHAPPAALEQLPPLDAVLLSHDHYDHLCADTMRWVAKAGLPIVTSLGVGRHLVGLGVDEGKVVELDWWERHQLPGHDVALTATPAQHFSGRGALDRNRALWSSWVIESARHRVFFSGDTGLTEEFKAIAQRFGPFDVTLLEVGAFHEAWGDIHLGPANAATAFEWLGGGALLPVHWGTFNLALHAWDEPAEVLLTRFERSPHRLLTPRLGQAFEPVRAEGPTPWWREAR